MNVFLGMDINTDSKKEKKPKKKDNIHKMLVGNNYNKNYLKTVINK